MAKVIEGYSSLHKDYDRYMDKAKFAYIGAFLSFLLIDWKGIFFIIAIGILLYALIMNSKANNYRTGIIGERTMKRVSQRLPETYTVVTNVELQAENKTIFYDAVIVGPAGVFVVEVKNMNGTISGHGSAYELTQYKTGRNGGSYSNDIRSPFRQLDGQIYQLSNLFKHHKLGVWIKGIVFFTHPEVKLKIKNPPVPIFSLRPQGAKYIKQMLLEHEKNQQPISQQAQDKIIELLTGKVA